MSGARQPKTLPARFVHLSTSQTAIVTRDGIRLLRAGRYWVVDSAELRRLLAALEQETSE